jgi:hypothetical protein
MKKAILAIIAIIAAAVALTGCSSYQSASGQDANGSYNANAAPAKNAISLQQYKSVPIGVACSAIIQQFGPPADKSDFNTDGYHDVTLSYNDVNDTGDYAIPQYMFDCINGALDSKGNM